MKLGLALGSGGARGWCHIGVIRKLEDMGVTPDMVAGCSMGALVGAAWAAGRLDALEDWARGLTRQKFLTYVDIRLGGGGLIRGRAVMDVLDQIDVPELIPDLGQPFLAVATDMATGREIWLRDSAVRDAVRASVSIPGLFSPHCIDGRWLLDGGLINPVPGSAARALGADVVIAVNPNGRHDGHLWKPRAEGQGMWGLLTGEGLREKLPETLGRLLPDGGKDIPPSPDYVDVVSTAIDIMTDYMRLTRAAGDPPHVTLDADLMDEVMITDLFRADRAIKEGHKMVRDKADEIARVCGL